jgi:heptosyltransferase-2
VITRLEHLALAAPNWVGDLVMATPMLEAAARAAHIGRVSVLVRAHLAPLLSGGPLEPLVQPYTSSRDELELLARLRPDALALLSNSFGAAWRAAKARVPIRMGVSLSARGWLLTHSFVPPAVDGRRHPIPTAHLHRDVLGLAGVNVESLHPRLYVSAAARTAQREQLRALGLSEPYVLCCPGAAFGAAKLWPPERFARALDMLHEERGWRAVVSGGPGEEPLIEAVARASRTGALSLAAQPRSLELLKALVQDAQVLLVGDSGPRWVAAAFDTPCVCVMGPNLPALTATSLELCEIVRVDLECSPCGERTCPLAHHRCMSEIGPERVAAAALRVVARKAGAGAAA